MMKAFRWSIIKTIWCACCALAVLPCFAMQDSLVIGNNAIARQFRFTKDSAGFFTTGFLHKATGQNYANPGTEEFRLAINGQVVSG